MKVKTLSLFFRAKVKLSKFGIFTDPRKQMDQDELYVFESVEPVKAAINLQAVSKYEYDKQSRIHFIGNSHAHSFTGSKLSTYGLGDVIHPFWDSISLGPLSSIDFVTIKWPLFEKLIQKNIIKPGDIILLTFGEAEARWYALKQRVNFSASESLNPEEQTQLIQPYIDAALEAYDRLTQLGFSVIAWSGHPSSRSDPREDPDMPVLGTTQNRNQMLIEWARQIEIGARERNIPFISVLDITLNSENETIEYFLDDVCHLNPSILEGIAFSKLSEIGIPISHFEQQV